MSMNQTQNWFGNIPNTWRTVPLWTVLRPRKNKNSEGSEQNLLSLSYGKIKRKDIETKTGLLPESFNGYNIIEAGDIVLRLTDLQNDMRSLRTGLAKEHGIITSAYLTLFPYRNDSSEYLQYLLHCYDIMKGFYNMGEGIRQGLGYDELSKLSLCLPSPTEQSRIAAFLDDRCAKIDEAIARHQALIGKLDEYKNALIVFTATHGVYTHKTKTVNLDWLHEMPQDWDIALLSQLYVPVKCKNSGLIETNLLSLSYGKIKQKDIENNEGLVPANFEGYNIIENDDIVLRLTDLQNDQKSLRVGISTQRGIVTSAYVTIRPKQKLCSKYFYYLLHSFDICKGFYGMGGGIRQGLNWDELKFVKLLLPSFNEQTAIVTFLDEKCAAIDSAKERHTQLIAKLEEQKKSLIYNAVTGKIEC